MEPDINDQFPAIRIVDLPAVRAVIAREFLNDAQALRGAPEGACRAAASAMAHDRAPRPGTLGSVRLMPHQVEAVERLERAISEFGGGLLCDEVGMGKTFVALALAKMSLRPLVVAPAALRSMWTRASAVAGVPVTVVSFESLSRGARPALQPDFLILDEAHHARNPSTRRYHEAALLALRSPVLMLSATPIHNRRGDLVALLSLFMGSRAHALTDAEVARCVVRRDHKSLGNDSRLPSVEVNSWIDISPEEEILPHVLALPPPVPLRLAGDGGALIVRSLIRQWASSEAALAGGLTRRLRKSEALLHALENGVYPSASEFTAWITSEDSVQLAFPTLVAPPAEAPAELLATVRRHQDALHRALGALGDSRARDRACASEIRAIRRQHEGAKIVAFSQYTDTVISLYGQLVLDGGVAALTSEGATVAGGRIPREEAIARFAPLAAGAPVPARSDEISLLLTTDLLSEGVNLQDAGVVIHLDLPWTPSRINQRTGRVARMGSNHRTVHSYAFRPPAAAAAAIGLESVLRAKARVIQEVVGGAATLLPFADFVHSSPAGPPAIDEMIRAVLAGWIRDDCVVDDASLVLAAAVRAPHRGFLCACLDGGRVALLCSNGRLVTDDPEEVLRAVLLSGGGASESAIDSIGDVLRLLGERSAARATLIGISRAATAVSEARRLLLHRISRIMAAARPHVRARLARVIDEAHAAAIAPLGVAAEAELFRLASLSGCSDEEWLGRLIEFVRTCKGEPEGSGTRGGAGHDRVIAVIVFDGKSPVNALARATER